MLPLSQLIEQVSIMAYCSRTVVALYGQKMANPALVRIGLNIVMPQEGSVGDAVWFECVKDDVLHTSI